jgi:hypothetical protein
MQKGLEANLVKPFHGVAGMAQKNPFDVSKGF